MIVSWDWLNDYVKLDMPVGQVTDRLTMAGLNLESISRVDGDTVVDLEVTSNRPDCLGHIGVAREIGVLFERSLRLPDADPKANREKAENATSVAIDCPDLCSLYIARVIRGVKVGPSPAWLRKRLATLGITSINNIVDATNYVLMECSQPLHAFDYDKLRGGKIIVRRPRPGEAITAINQRNYLLEADMCVIADAERPVAIGGVMGGLETEIGDRTTNVLIETAAFSPVSIRSTARKLHLHSDSSYRFERGVDSANADWASRRCCEIIQDVAGGQLLEGAVVAGAKPGAPRKPVVLRYAQIPRVLGIEIPQEDVKRILTALGLVYQVSAHDGEARFVPPSWRADLTREIDLIEEVARIHGYDKIPDNVTVPLILSSRTRRERVADKVRDLLTSAGFFEAVTMSFVSDEVRLLFAPKGEKPPLVVDHPSRRQEDVLRQSLIGSLLQSRRENERHGVFTAELFEIAKVYLDAAPGESEAKVEPVTVGLVSGKDFGQVRGVVEALAKTASSSALVSVEPSQLPQFVAGRGADVYLNGVRWGWLGELERSVTDRLDLRDTVVAAELDFALLEAAADLTRTFTPLPQFPPIDRDLNFVLDEAATWRQLEDVVRSSSGSLLETISFVDQYRGKQIGAGKKSYVVTLRFRAPDRTLTAEEVDKAQQAVIEACASRLNAVLR